MMVGDVVFAGRQNGYGFKLFGPVFIRGHGDTSLMRYVAKL